MIYINQPSVGCKATSELLEKFQNLIIPSQELQNKYLRFNLSLAEHYTEHKKNSFWITDNEPTVIVKPEEFEALYTLILLTPEGIGFKHYLKERHYIDVI